MEQFMKQVNEQLNTLNNKLDSVIKGQSQINQKLEDIDNRVKKNTLEISNVAKTIDFVSEKSRTNTDEIKTVSSTVSTLENELQSAKSIIDSLQHDVINLERYTRGFNIRVSGVQKTEDENCRIKLTDILKDKIGIEGDVIENAHRVISRNDGNRRDPPHIIARFHSRACRAEVMRTARAKLAGTTIRFMDDLTARDLEEKQRIQPYMDKLWRDKRRPRFRNGRLYANGPTTEIETFLVSDEGMAATRASRRRHGTNQGRQLTEDRGQGDA